MFLLEHRNQRKHKIVAEQINSINLCQIKLLTAEALSYIETIKKIWIIIHYISSCGATRMNFPNSLLPSISIIHRFWQVFQATFHLCRELLLISSSWLSYTCASMWSSSLENIAYEFVFAPPEMSCMSCCLIWIDFEMGGRWPYSCCFTGCCFQDLFNIAHSILV